ncbi:phosphoribosylanthranilate isomerase [Candidatus Vidania fulgoroideae]|uniref:N-(5'-phosphoribosyl)anthranilate isomerase n=1 Tax=Candidatus Vidania fulgoroideorum TaxID=881286 RepID=A0AAX3N8H1_9PROT|nr:phosphoribosylanthranilate isomerase [Candidatus Vidania fulgoroideae]WDR79376.1 phosphoribosylanthranilate isomerase [Candidatus Vidania fulgoroideae]
MSLTKIKFCGIRDIKTLKFCKEINVDAIGFVFYKKSLRNISIKKAVLLSNLLKSSYIYKFAIVVKPKISFLKKIFKNINIDFLQFYGKENKKIIDLCYKYKTNFLKVYKFNGKKDIDVINKSKYNFVSVEKKNIGGTGKTINFNKNLLNIKKKIMISGGINKKNIYYIVRKIKPFFLDISSGIEKKGIKDRILMRSVLKELSLSNIKNVY